MRRTRWLPSPLATVGLAVLLAVTGCTSGASEAVSASTAGAAATGTGTGDTAPGGTAPGGTAPAGTSAPPPITSSAAVPATPGTGTPSVPLGSSTGVPGASGTDGTSGQDGSTPADPGTATAGPGAPPTPSAGGTVDPGTSGGEPPPPGTVGSGEPGSTSASPPIPPTSGAPVDPSSGAAGLDTATAAWFGTVCGAQRRLRTLGPRIGGSGLAAQRDAVAASYRQLATVAGDTAGTLNALAPPGYTGGATAKTRQIAAFRGIAAGYRAGVRTVTAPTVRTVDQLSAAVRSVESSVRERVTRALAGSPPVPAAVQLAVQSIPDCNGLT
ncbi:hypothetical protein [Nakamurella endophytica]|uniref:Collagen triple helix repeat protein n=1 Tax=Nakamurella endophytica TaxID=1748367 RepID=A0A917WI93_9ACTN|nr:hypothetical protein [Nakamurella endophytica]GGM05285.1 hypothetical protein GCM10011594_26890 [Nakamurella endophytica]